MRPSVALVVFLLIVGATPGVLPGQSLGIAAGRDRPAWLDQWSPLGIQGSLPRTLPGASVVVPLLMLPPPRVGLFWTGGNPGALPWDVVDERTDVVLARAGQEGEYRRPLDPAAASVTQVNGFGWRPLGVRGAVIGGVVLDRSLREQAVSTMNEPYGSSPFVVTDTSTSTLRQNRARLEGAGGWRIGEFGVGVSLGYEARTTASVAAPLLRRNRAVAPAAVVGVVRRFRGGRLSAGVRGSLLSARETINLVEVAQEGAVYQLEGYREVPLQNIVGGYYRRMSRALEAVGLSAGGMVGDATWSAHADVLRNHEQLTGEQEDDPVVESWRTRGFVSGASLQIPWSRKRGILTLRGRVIELVGHSEQVFPTRSGHTTDEKVLEGSAEVRLLPSLAGWTAVVHAGVSAEYRTRSDSVAGARTNLNAATGGFALEVGRQLNEALMVLGGVAISRYGGNTVLPSASSRGAVYQKLFAPELDIASSAITAQALKVALRWQPTRSSSVWLAGRLERVSSHDVFPFVPGGARMARTLLLGYTLGTAPGLSE